MSKKTKHHNKPLASTMEVRQQCSIQRGEVAFLASDATKSLNQSGPQPQCRTGICALRDTVGNSLSYLVFSSHNVIQGPVLKPLNHTTYISNMLQRSKDCGLIQDARSCTFTGIFKDDFLHAHGVHALNSPVESPKFCEFSGSYKRVEVRGGPRNLFYLGQT